MSQAEFDAFPDLAFGGNDVLSEVASQLAMGDLARSLRVSKAWRGILDGTPFIWRALCEHAWEGKAYVPASLRSMAEGESALQRAAGEATRAWRRASGAVVVRQETCACVRSLGAAKCQ